MIKYLLCFYQVEEGSMDAIVLEKRKPIVWVEMNR